MRRHDLLVLGGGPAGSALATLAAASGARVLLVERKRFPRDKVCGEFVSAEGKAVLEKLGVLDELLSAGATWMDSCRITGLDGRRLDAFLPELPHVGREALGVSRELLDTTLLELARRRGAEVREGCAATAPIVEEGRVTGAYLRREGASGPGEAVRASIVVAADGRRSVLLRAIHARLADPSRSGRRSWFGLKVHLSGDPGRLGRRVELHLFDGGYAGLAPVEGQRINLCLMVRVADLRACGGAPSRLFHERVLGNPSLRRVLEGARPCSAWKSVGPLRFGVRRPAAAGALFVGDAAGTIDPFCGEGIANALRNAELALPFAMEAAAWGGLSRDLAARYEKAWSLVFGPVTRRVRWLGRLFEHPRLAGATISLLGGAGSRLLPNLLQATRTGARGSATLAPPERG